MLHEKVKMAFKNFWITWLALLAVVVHLLTLEVIARELGSNVKSRKSSLLHVI